MVVVVVVVVVGRTANLGGKDDDDDDARGREHRLRAAQGFACTLRRGGERLPVCVSDCAFVAIICSAAAHGR